MGLILSIVHSSRAIKQVYNCEANDLGPVIDYIRPMDTKLVSAPVHL